MELMGRTTITANYTEKEFLKGTTKDRQKRVLEILQNSIDIHRKNAKETKFLLGYLYGRQDIRHKEKKTRTDINHKKVENWVYAFVDWKKTFLLGKPIQYAPLNDVGTQEISILNKYVQYDNKGQLDVEIYQDVLTCGRGFRFIGRTEMNEDDETPFEILNLEPDRTEVVYSSGIRKEQLGAYYITPMETIVTKKNDVTGEEEPFAVPYEIINFYTRKEMFRISNEGNEWKVLEIVPIILNEHLIKEYYVNKARISMIEIGKDMFDDINYIQNLDMDDTEAFVNSIMVFTNAEIDAAKMDEIKEYGALSIKSTDTKSAKVEILQSRLKALETEIFYLRKLNALHNILGVPMASNNGSPSNAETGKAMLTGQGFTSANIRIEGDVSAIQGRDRETLKTLLKIAKKHPKSEIKNLAVGDIDIKLTRDMSENLLVKTQALINLRSAQIPDEIANSVIGLFSDPVSVTQMQQDYMNKLSELQEVKQEVVDIEKQNNEIQDVLETQEQEQ